VASASPWPAPCLLPLGRGPRSTLRDEFLAKEFRNRVPLGGYGFFTALPYDTTPDGPVTNSFTVSNGVLTAASYYIADNGTYGFILGYNGYNDLYVDSIGTSDFNSDGFSGATYTLVSPLPEPAAIALFASGLIVLGAVRWRAPVRHAI
jgi:hypothetical protein